MEERFSRSLSPPPASSPLNGRVAGSPMGSDGSCGLRGPHGHSSGVAHRAGCLGSAGGIPPAAAGL